MDCIWWHHQDNRAFPSNVTTKVSYGYDFVRKCDGEREPFIDTYEYEKIVNLGIYKNWEFTDITMPVNLFFL